MSSNLTLAATSQFRALLCYSSLVAEPDTKKRTDSGKGRIALAWTDKNFWAYCRPRLFLLGFNQVNAMRLFCAWKVPEPAGIKCASPSSAATRPPGVETGKTARPMCVASANHGKAWTRRSPERGVKIVWGDLMPMAWLRWRRICKGSDLVLKHWMTLPLPQAFTNRDHSFPPPAVA